MTPRPTLVRRVATAAGLAAALGAACASPASAVPVSVSLDYTCTFPLLRPEPLRLVITSDIPASVAIDAPTGVIAIKATAAVSSGAARGLRGVETATLEGSAKAAATVTRPGATPLPLTVPTTIAKTPLPASGEFTTAAAGSAPSLSFRQAGQARINVGDLVLSLTPRLADGTPTGLDTFETECKQNAGQDNLLAAITVGSATTSGPTKPGAIVATPTASSAALTWGASTDDIAVAGYDVYQDGVKRLSTTGASATVTGLDANKTYAFKVQARDADGNLSPFSDEVSVTTTGGTVVPYAFNAVGSATLKTLTQGNLPLKGRITANLRVSDGDFTAGLALEPATGNLRALGFLPVTAKVGITQTENVTGSLKSGVLNANAKVRIKIPSVTLFGLPLAGGANCQAKNVSNINLKSVDPTFLPTVGGTIAGSFAISDLAGCGFLNGIVSPLVAGSGNAIALKLTPTPVV